LIDPERLALFSTEHATPLAVLEAWAVPICGSLLAAEMLARILGCNSAATARNATLLGAGIYLVVGLIPVAIGLAGPALVPGLDEPEQVVATLAQRHLSTFFYVLFAGAVISAILSTVNSCLLAAASLVSHNLIVPLRPAIDERGKVLTARIGVVVFGAAAYALALGADGIYELVATASAFGSAGIFVVGLFGLFSRVGGVASAHASLATGALVWAAGEYWLEWPTPYVAALAASLAAYLLPALFVRGAAAEAGGARDGF
jgi:Na+/proline symporter